LLVGQNSGALPPGTLQIGFLTPHKAHVGAGRCDIISPRLPSFRYVFKSNHGSFVVSKTRWTLLAGTMPIENIICNCKKLSWKGTDKKNGRILRKL
jgi:hypothetical protein